MISNSEKKLTINPRARIDDPTHPLYAETVYAGILGKLIGVYLGRPVENWSHEKIVEEFGEIRYYVHEQRGRRLVITDDDISGTLIFLRALQDYGYNTDISPADIGQTWLNYLIEEKTILWWGGLGNSTEHTAYLRLKNGIKAPESGSAGLNSKIISEQIGAQIFIDGWGLICPGDPKRASDFARKAASVSHDGEAVFGAQVIAAMVAGAFVEQSIERLLDIGVSVVPPDCVVRKLIDDVREWHIQDKDWHRSLANLHSQYGYDKYQGQCHLIPNHGVIILSLLHGMGDFDESMMIVNTSGWDTDCNSGNVGAILGVRNGLQTFEHQDWRGPVADRLYLPSADPGRSITDAVRESVEVVNASLALHHRPLLQPKGGARFHFCFPGSTQGFRAQNPDAGSVRHFNYPGDSSIPGLRLSRNPGSTEPLQVSTPTFIPPDTKDMVTGYVLVACPTLYSGHIVEVDVRSLGEKATGKLFIEAYNSVDETQRFDGATIELMGGELKRIQWEVPDTEGFPIHHIGLEIVEGEIFLERMDWRNIPNVSWPPVEGSMWHRAWGNALDRFAPNRDRYEYMAMNVGTGFLAQGHREWRDYSVSCRITPRMAESGGVAVRYQGCRRYYAFVFGAPGEVRLEKALDGVTSLARVPFNWKPFEDYEVTVEAIGSKLRLFIDGELILQTSDEESPLESGGFAFVVTSGCMGAGTPRIEPR
ncbi:MAG: ADP-ribosylglycohydrolase family protein [Fimbriimonadaceae bacterium]